MSYPISRPLASQIVDAVSDVCEKNINFITPDGEIIASTDSSRIGTYHEIGRRAAQSGTLMRFLRIASILARKLELIFQFITMENF